MSDHHTPSVSADDAGRAGQAAIVALCIVGLFVAALVTPAAGGIDGPDPELDPPDAQPPETNASGGDGTDGPTIRDLLELLGFDDGGDGSVERRSSCVIRLDERPVPGKEVTVTVYREGEPVEDARVSFNGDTVGRTDEEGQVTGEVPYVKTLDVDVEMPVGEDCTGTAETERVDGATERLAALGGVAAATEPSPVGGSGPVPMDPGGLLAGTDGLVAAELDGERPRDVNQTYEVRGDIYIGYDGEPLPGETVTLRATIEGVPVEDGTVTVGGRRVGTTDDDGEYELTVPDDGTERVQVAVTRGEFSGRRTIPVSLLSVRLAPDGLLAVPGGSASVVATLGEDPAVGADVLVDGETVGTTDRNGTATIRLPADPATTVTVTTGRQEATASLWRVYAGTAVALGTLVVVAVGALVAVVGGVSRYGRMPERPERAGGWLAQRLVRAALWLSDAIERVLRWTGRRLRTLRARVQAFLAGLPRSVPGLVRHLVDGAVSVGRDLLGWLVAAVGWLARWPRRLWRSFRRGDGGDAGDERVDSGPATTDRGGPSLRERWRTFARWVVPERWRTRTPGEVARAARERGFPDEPVAELTRVFRDVEYGDRPLTEDRRERAREAFEEMEEVRER